MTATEAVAECWRQGLLSYKLHASQADIYAQLRALPLAARTAVALISRRWGKTWLCCCMALEDCLQGPNRNVFVIAPSMVHATKITLPQMRLVTADAPAGLIKQTKSTFQWTFPNGSTLTLATFDTAPENMRGSEACNLYFEETGFVEAGEDYEYTVKSIFQPTLLHSQGRMVHFTTPPRYEDHPFNVLTLPAADAAGALYVRTIHDNPRLTPEQIADECKDQGGPQSLSWRREYLCERGLRDASFVAIPEFSDALVREFEIPTHFFSIVAGDLGGSRDRTHFLLLGYDFKRAVTLVVDERSFDKQTASKDVIVGVKAMEAEWGLAQPARYLDCPEQTRRDLQVYDAFTTLPPSNRGDKFEVNLNFIRTGLGAVEIHPRCKDLILCLRYARLDKQRTGFARSEQIGHADAAMALCYGLRHVNRNNPYPAWGGASPMTHHIPDTRPQLAPSAQVLRSLFSPTR